MVTTKCKGLRLLLVAAAAVTVLGGCAAGMGGRDYQRAEARRAMTVQYGVIQEVRVVKLEGTKTPLGSLGGAAIGGIAGSTVGSGRGASIATVIGAIAGGVAGSAVEEGATRQTGLELTVRLDNGQTLAVVQADEGEGFRIGDRVRVLEDGRSSRVAR
jgi:outer membrane lipoprotein SlyB